MHRTSTVSRLVAVMTLMTATMLTAPVATAAKKATFVEADLHLGMASSPYQDEDVGLAWGGMLGIGGKLRTFPLRFYLMAGFTHQPGEVCGVFSPTGEEFTLDQDIVDLYLGPRIVIPIVRGLRAYVDLMGLASYQKMDLIRGDTISKKSGGWLGGALLAVGLQYRWHRNASTGLRLEWAIYSDPGTTLPGTVGLEPKSNGKLALSLVQGWYF